LAKAKGELVRRGSWTALTAAVMLTLTGSALAQTDKLNFPNRQAVIINNANSYVDLTSFGFENRYSQSTFRLITNLAWKNVSTKPITAFEVVVLKYDPFNRPIFGGGQWMITGHNSGDWTPLMPGQSSNDGLVGYESEPVLTSVVYVRAIRFQDGNVWSADLPAVEKAIRQKLPVLKDLGEVSPSAKKAKSP